MSLDNFGIVTSTMADAFLFRSAQPCTQAAAETLRRLQVGLVFKLDSDTEFRALSTEEEARLLPFANIAKVPQDPLSPCEASTRKLVEEIHAALASGINVLVHCVHGRDRTGLVCGAYHLIHDGWTLRDVNRERAQYGVAGLIKIADLPIDSVLQSIARSPHP